MEVRMLIPANQDAKRFGWIDPEFVEELGYVNMGTITQSSQFYPSEVLGAENLTLIEVTGPEDEVLLFAAWIN